MKLTKSLTATLQDYSKVNSSIVFNQGNVLSTVSEAKNILSYTKLDMEIPQTFGIYDLKEFIGILGLVNDPTLVFHDTHVEIRDSTGRSSVKYFFTDTDILTKPPLKENFKVPEFEVEFSLTGEVLSQIIKAATALKQNELAVRPKNGLINLTVQDSDNSTSNTFSIDVDGSYPSDAGFCLICNIQNLKVLPPQVDYIVGISSQTISRFTVADQDLEYFIAFEKTSSYGE